MTKYLKKSLIRNKFKSLITKKYANRVLKNKNIIKDNKEIEKDLIEINQRELKNKNVLKEDIDIEIEDFEEEFFEENKENENKTNKNNQKNIKSKRKEKNLNLNLNMNMNKKKENKKENNKEKENVIVPVVSLESIKEHFYTFNLKTELFTILYTTLIFKWIQTDRVKF
jgi:hypothetical protein